MVFSSLFFLYVFLPLNLLFYHLMPSMRAKNTVMMIFSLIFYAWGEPVYVFLLLAMAFADWILALYISALGGGQARGGAHMSGQSGPARYFQIRYILFGEYA